MRVRVTKPFTAYWNYSVTKFTEGAEMEGEQARHFVDNAPAGCIEVLEADPQPEPERAPALAPAAGDERAGAGAAGGDELPVDGTIDQLMAWVGGDPERAGKALAAEQAKDKPRSTVVKRLTALADGDEE